MTFCLLTSISILLKTRLKTLLKNPDYNVEIRGWGSFPQIQVRAHNKVFNISFNYKYLILNLLEIFKQIHKSIIIIK